MTKNILLSLSAAVVFSCAAFAGSADVTERQTKVAFGDLNLNSEAGVTALFERLSDASKTVCGPLPSTLGPARAFEEASYKSCKAAAFHDAVVKLGDKVPSSYRTAAK